MWVRKWLTSDFHVKCKAKAGNDLLLAGHIGEGVLLTHRKKEDSDEWNLDPVRVEAIRIKKGELEIWDEEDRGWAPVASNIRRAFTDALADNALLGGNDGGNSNSSNQEDAIS